jgi:hypothetical protein
VVYIPLHLYHPGHLRPSRHLYHFYIFAFALLFILYPPIVSRLELNSPPTTAPLPLTASLSQHPSHRGKPLGLCALVVVKAPFIEYKTRDD